MKIANDTLAILSKVTVEGNLILLTCGQLDRKQYTAVNTVLANMGGNWTRKLKGHLFDEDPTDALEQVLLTGEIIKPEKFGYFPTPPELAQKVIDLADIQPSHMVLEPSAGQGNLVRLIPKGAQVICVELLEKNFEHLYSRGYDCINDDFLKPHVIQDQYDRIVMNPPFEKQADINHVTKAYGHLKPGGRLVAIMSAGITFRENKKTTDFRCLVDWYGSITPNPEGSFKVSGTMVNTVTVVLDKP